MAEREQAQSASSTETIELPLEPKARVRTLMGLLRGSMPEDAADRLSVMHTMLHRLLHDRLTEALAGTIELSGGELKSLMDDFKRMNIGVAVQKDPLAHAREQAAKAARSRSKRLPAPEDEGHDILGRVGS